MRRLSFRPALTMRGRTSKGLRGWAGKPLHPPLTDVPVGAYVLAAAFDLISFLGRDQEWARDLYRAATFALIGGGFNVETSGDHPVWYRSEDVFPGDKG